MSDTSSSMELSSKECSDMIKLQNEELDRLLETIKSLKIRNMSQDCRIEQLEKDLNQLLQNMEAKMLDMVKNFLCNVNNLKELRELGVLPPLSRDLALTSRQRIAHGEQNVDMGNGADVQPAGGSAQVPAFVRLLQKVDPRERQTLVDLQQHLDNMGKQPHTSTFPMYKVQGPTADTSGTFFLHVGKGLSRQIAIFDRSQVFGECEEPNEDVTGALGIFELHARRNADIKGKGKAIARLVLPRYVLYLGEMHEERRRSNGAHVDALSMNYHVVMDITHPDKALWVIWKYDEKQKGLKQKGRDRVSFIQPPSEKPGVPLYQGCPPVKVDLLKLLSKVRDWNALAMFEDGSGPGALMNEVNFNCQPCFTIPMPDEMERCLKWSWHAAPKGGN